MQLGALSSASLMTETLQSAADEQIALKQDNSDKQPDLAVKEQTVLGAPAIVNPLIQHAAESKKTPASLTALFGAPRSLATTVAKTSTDELADAGKREEQTNIDNGKIPLKTPEDKVVASATTKVDDAQSAPAATKNEAKLALVTAKPANPATSKPRNYDFALPGVRANGGVEIKHRNTVFSYDDIDADEGDFLPSFQLASAPGMLRSAPNGLRTQHESVQVACLNPKLVGMIKTLERRFGKHAVVTSGYRSPSHNIKVNGARRSLHMSCSAADIQIAGISKWELAKAIRAIPGRGGVGTYCHTNSVHLDTGAERDWNWRCRKK